MVTETASGHSPGAVQVAQKEGTPAHPVKGLIAETLFAYGNEVAARPSATGYYLVPELEVSADAVDLAYGFGTISPRGRTIQFQFDKTRGEVGVRVILPASVVEQTVLEMQQGSRSIWNLGELSDWAMHGISEIGAGALGALAATGAAISAPPHLGLRVESEVPDERPGNTEIGIESQPLRDDASVKQLAARLSELTGLHDGELAQLFLGRGSRQRVSREHYQRWRTGKKENATAANRRRMWFLVRLLEPLARAGVGIGDWLRNTTEVDNHTALELLRLGRFDDVERLAARLMPVPEAMAVISAEGRPVLLEQGPASFTPRTEEPTTDLVFEDDEAWIETEDDVEDEMDDA